VGGGVRGVGGGVRGVGGGVREMGWLAGLALADPGQCGFGGGLGLLVLAVAPGTARAIFVFPLAAENADHADIVLRVRGSQRG
jgi:hypothetical protein